MAESMAGLKRSCRCTEVTEANVGQELTLMGWVQKSRNKGGIIFTDLRDRTGLSLIHIWRPDRDHDLPELQGPQQRLVKPGQEQPGEK